MIRTRLYRSGFPGTENFPVEDISEHLTQPGAPSSQDVYDHVLRAPEWAGSPRDLVTTVLGTSSTTAIAADQP